MTGQHIGKMCLKLVCMSSNPLHKIVMGGGRRHWSDPGMPRFFLANLHSILHIRSLKNKHDSSVHKSLSLCPFQLNSVTARGSMLKGVFDLGIDPLGHRIQYKRGLRTQCQLMLAAVLTVASW